MSLQDDLLPTTPFSNKPINKKTHGKLKQNVNNDESTLHSVSSSSLCLAFLH